MTRMCGAAYQNATAPHVRTLPDQRNERLPNKPRSNRGLQIRAVSRLRNYYEARSQNATRHVKSARRIGTSIKFRNESGTNSGRIADSAIRSPEIGPSSDESYQIRY